MRTLQSLVGESLTNTMFQEAELWDEDILEFLGKL